MKAALRIFGTAKLSKSGTVDQMHTMTLIHEHEGTGEWLCSTCGRHLLVSWEPVFSKTVLEEGDSSANHIRIKRTVQTVNKRDTPAALLPKPVAEPDNDPRLAPWLNWMEESGFENLWNNKPPSC